MKRFWSSFAILLVTFVLTADLTIVNTALHDLQTIFKISIIEVQWIINAFGLALACFMIPMGRVADSWGYKNTLYLGAFLFIVFSLVAGLASNAYVLIGARFFLGISGAILQPVTQLLIYQNYPKSQKRKAMALWVMAMGIGLVVGPFLGGFFVTYFSWRYIFFIPALVLLLATILIYFFVHDEHVPVTKKVHPLEIVLLLLGLSSLIFAIVESSYFSLASWPILLLFCASILFLGLLILFEKGLSDPMIPFKLSRNIVFVCCCFISVSLSIVNWIGLFLVPLYLQKVYFFTAFEAGLFLLFQAGSVVFSGQLLALINNLCSTKKLILVGFALSFVGQVLQGLLSFNYVLLAISLVSMGVASTLLISNTSVLAFSIISKGDMGVVAGVLRTAQSIGGMLGVAICTALIAHYSIEKAYSITYLTLSIVGALTSVFLYWLIPGEKNKTA